MATCDRCGNYENDEHTVFCEVCDDEVCMDCSCEGLCLDCWEESEGTGDKSEDE